METCGSLTVELKEAGQNDFQHNGSAKTLSLVSSLKTNAAILADIYLLVALGTLEWQLPVTATFEPCNLKRLSFVESKVTLHYTVGA